MTGTSCNEHAVYEINFEQNLEEKKTGKEKIFAKIFKIFGNKQERLVSKLMFVYF